MSEEPHTSSNLFNLIWIYQVEKSIRLVKLIKKKAFPLSSRCAILFVTAELRIRSQTAQL